MSSEELKEISKIPTLRGQEDYRIWAVKLKAVLRLGTVWTIVNRTETALGTDAEQKLAFNK